MVTRTVRVGALKLSSWLPAAQRPDTAMASGSRRWLLACAVIALVGPARADAGTVASSVDRGTNEDGPWQAQQIAYRADRGVSDRVEIALTPSGVVVRDANGLRPGTGCQPAGRNAARCALVPRAPDVDATQAFVRLRATTLDRADRLRMSVSPTIADARVSVLGYGGSGDDDLAVDTRGSSTLSGGAGADVLRAGPGFDRLDGGDGDDVVRAGGGDDYFPFSRGRDRLDGGSGADSLGASGVRVPVRIDLSRGIAHAPGFGHHRIRGIENAGGGARADQLIGDAGPNQLDGDAGDRLDGRGGDDRLVGEPAVALGGPGDDALPWPVGRRLDCGSGEDAIPPDDQSVPRGVPSSCEWYGDGSARLPPPWVWFARHLSLDGATLTVRIWNRAAQPVHLQHWVSAHTLGQSFFLVESVSGVVDGHARQDLHMPLTEAGARYFAAGASSAIYEAATVPGGLLWLSAIAVTRSALAVPPAVDGSG